VFRPFAFAAELNNLPPLARKALEPVTVDWPHEIARLQDWTKLVPDPVFLARPDWSGGLPEVSLSSLWGTYFIESAKSGRLKADELSRVMTEHKWTAEQLASFWDRLDRETADRARRPDVAGQVLAAIEQTPHLKEAFGEGASVDALFGLAQVKLFARKLPEARAALEAILARLPEKTEAGHASRGVAAYRMAQSYEFASDFEAAREWYLKCAEWGTPEKTGGYDVRSEGCGEAARMCRRLGRDEEAMTYYRKAIDECGQWGQAVASMDLCGLLLKANKPDEAAALLQPLATGRNGPVAAVYALLTIARLRSDQGNALAARACATQALEAMATVTDAQALAMLLSSRDEARSVLSALDRWEQDPIVVRPRRLVLGGGPDNSPPCASFTVSTMAASTLTIAAPNWLRVERAGDTFKDAGGTHQPFRATADPDTHGRPREGEIAVGAQEHPDWQLLVPVERTEARLEATPR
jgi:tetratricopeptide (TPR) repeat protein